MSDLPPAVKAAEELEPAVTAFAEATGALGPVREFAAWATDLIRYRRAPHQAELLMRAAEKIRASGLPSSAVEDKLLRAVLENGPLEDDEDMRERWSNLLANASVRPDNTSRIAFARILSELEPIEAYLLDRLAANTGDDRIPLSWAAASFGVNEMDLDNLERLGLIRYRMLDAPTYEDMLDLDRANRATFSITTFGASFVQACSSP